MTSRAIPEPGDRPTADRRCGGPGMEDDDGAVDTPPPRSCQLSPTNVNIRRHRGRRPARAAPAAASPPRVGFGRQMQSFADMRGSYRGRSGNRRRPARAPRAKTRETPWLSLAFLGFAWLFRRTKLGFPPNRCWLLLAFEERRRYHILTPGPRAPEPVEGQARSAVPRVRSRYTSTNSRARRACERDARRTQHGP